MSRLLLMTIACLLVLFGISGLWMLPKLIQQKIEQVSVEKRFYFTTYKLSEQTNSTKFKFSTL